MYWRTNFFAQEPLRQPLVDRSRRGDIAGLRVRASRVRPHVPDLPLCPHLQSVVRRHGQVRGLQEQNQITSIDFGSNDIQGDPYGRGKIMLTSNSKFHHKPG